MLRIRFLRRVAGYPIALAAVALWFFFVCHARSVVQGECTEATLPRMKRYALAVALLVAVHCRLPPPKKATVPMKPLTPAELHSLAHDYYEWQKKTYPVGASDQGFHAADDKLDDFSPAAIARDAAHVRALLDRVRAADVAGWAKDDVIDWLLFRSQLEGADFPERVLQAARRPIRRSTWARRATPSSRC